MTRRLHALAAAALAMTLAACADSPSVTQEAERQESAVVTATVQSVDLETRQVLLRDDQTGDVGVFTAGPEVRNLPQLEAGDRVRIEYFDSVAVRMAEPGEDATPLTVAAAGRAPEGQRPGGFVATSTDLVMEFVSYDAGLQTATLIDPEGERVTVPVQPEMRAFAKARTPGERIHVTLSEAVAIDIVEIAE